MQTLGEKLTVRSKPCQSQGVRVGLAVNQQQVGLDVAFAIARPIAGKIMIAVTSIQWLIGRLRDQDRLEILIERGTVSALGLPFVVALER